MDRPTIVHPKRFLIEGVTYKVIAYYILTDAQAEKIVLRFRRSQLSTIDRNARKIGILFYQDKESLESL